MLPRIYDSNGNRTRVTAVKGRCLNRLTMEPSQTCLSGCTNEPYLIWLPNKSGTINNRSLNQFTSYPTGNLTKNILSQLSSFGKRKLMNSKTFYNSGCQFLRRHAATLLEQENSAIHGAEKCHILEHFLRPWNKMYKWPDTAQRIWKSICDSRECHVKTEYSRSLRGGRYGKSFGMGWTV